MNGVDHRLFADDELWVGKDLDFHSIADASFVRLKSVDSKSQVYHGFVGQALVTFTCRYVLPFRALIDALLQCHSHNHSLRWHRVNDNLYKYSLDYESHGVGANLFEDFRLRIDGDPRTVTFLI